IGTATDPYQQAESQYRLTRGILQAFRDFRNPVSITTKSPMIERDLDILTDLVGHASVTVCLSITTLDESIWRKVEPTTSKPSKRLATLRRLSGLGINAGVLLCPVLPGITDRSDQMEAVVAAAAEHGARFLSTRVLRLGKGIGDYYLPFVEREFPGLRRSYADLYRGDYAPEYYVQTIRARVDDLRQRYGLSADRTDPAFAVSPHPPRQLDLFAAA
ncbi:MAG TPA: radical SAM protein, partial [Chloroflexota bacterium]|nr:radical SAM protein [Chloroflexota bacterium]